MLDHKHDTCGDQDFGNFNVRRDVLYLNVVHTHTERERGGGGRERSLTSFTNFPL